MQTEPPHEVGAVVPRSCAPVPFGRTHLRTYLEALLRNVDEWARAEQSPAGLEPGQPQT